MKCLNRLYYYLNSCPSFCSSFCLNKGTAFLLVALLISFSSNAKQATPMAKDPVLEEKVKAVSAELRCLVCQNQTIADSSAALAVDLKNQVREMLSSGKTEAEVIDYMVERYGDFVRYRPPIKPTTVLLWFGPLLFLIIGGSFLFVNLARRRKRVTSVPSLSDAEIKQVNELLDTVEKDTP